MAQIIRLHPLIADYPHNHVRIPEPMFTGRELVWACAFSAMLGAASIGVIMGLFT